MLVIFFSNTVFFTVAHLSPALQVSGNLMLETFFYFKLKTLVGKGFFVKVHCVKSVPIWSFSGPYFPAFGLNTQRYYIFVFGPEHGPE